MEMGITGLYKFAVLVHDNEIFSELPWNSSFIKEAKSGGNYDFGTDGQFWSGKKPKGLYNFISSEELYASYPSLATELTLMQKCPYLGKALGVFTWEWYLETMENEKYNALNFVNVSGSNIFKTTTSQYFECIKNVTYPLADITEKTGFGDGDAFLYYSRNKDEYYTYLQQLIGRKLDGLNMNHSFINYGTSHNPVQITGYKLADMPKLKDKEITFWGMDIKLFQNTDLDNFLNGE